LANNSSRFEPCSLFKVGFENEAENVKKVMTVTLLLMGMVATGLQAEEAKVYEGKEHWGKGTISDRMMRRIEAVCDGKWDDPHLNYTMKWPDKCAKGLTNLKAGLERRGENDMVGQIVDYAYEHHIILGQKK
jgi:hypothetical protein